MEAAVISTAVSILGSAYYTKANADRQKKAIKRSNAYMAESAALQDQQAKLALAERHNNRPVIRPNWVPSDWTVNQARVRPI